MRTLIPITLLGVLCIGCAHAKTSTSTREKLADANTGHDSSMLVFSNEFISPPEPLKLIFLIKAENGSSYQVQFLNYSGTSIQTPGNQVGSEEIIGRDLLCRFPENMHQIDSLPILCNDVNDAGIMFQMSPIGVSGPWDSSLKYVVKTSVGGGVNLDRGVYRRIDEVQSENIRTLLSKSNN